MSYCAAPRRAVCGGMTAGGAPRPLRVCTLNRYQTALQVPTRSGLDGTYSAPQSKHAFPSPGCVSIRPAARSASDFAEDHWEYETLWMAVLYNLMCCHFCLRGLSVCSVLLTPLCGKEK